MNNHTPGAWKYLKNDDGTFSIITVGNRKFETGFATNLIAKVFTEGIIAPEDNARLITSAPEMYQALCYETETLRSTEIFMRDQGLNTENLSEIINVADDLIQRIEDMDGEQEAKS